MTTGPIVCDEELKRLPNTNWDLTCALLTMILREDHFCEGSLIKRQNNGQVNEVLYHMIELLKE